MNRPPEKKRRLVILIVLAVAIAIFVLTDSSDQSSTEAIADVVPRNHTSSPLKESTGEIPLEQLKRKEIVVSSSDIFTSKSWYVPPPPRPKRPPPPPPPPAAPTAPPLPFSYMGKIQEPGGSMTIYLEGQGQLFLVKGGETLLNNYRVDGVQNGLLVLTYLPLNTKQYIPLGDAQ